MLSFRCFASCEGLPPTDVLEIQSELEKARDTLAQVQALHMEVGEKARAYHYDRKVVTASKRHSQQKSSKTKVSSDWKRAEARTITIQRNSPTQNPAPRTANTKSMGKPTILAKYVSLYKGSHSYLGNVLALGISDTT